VNVGLSSLDTFSSTFYCICSQSSCCTRPSCSCRRSYCYGAGYSPWCIVEIVTTVVVPVIDIVVVVVIIPIIFLVVVPIVILVVIVVVFLVVVPVVILVVFVVVFLVLSANIVICCDRRFSCLQMRSLFSLNLYRQEEFTWFNTTASFNRCGESEASKGGDKKRDLNELHFG
jgi:hypothetical protein